MLPAVLDHRAPASAAPRTPAALSVAEARERFPSTAGYFNACTLGLPSHGTVAALTANLADWSAGDASAVDYGAAVERTRSSFARLVGVPVDRVAIGSQTSVIASVIAAALPDGAEVLTVHGDFSSMVFPFLAQAHRGVAVRSVPLEELAASVTPATALVAFSFIQSSSGRVADVDAIVEAAAAVGARTFCDLTQAAGVHPIDATIFDATVTHAYKWLCSPRGVAFLTVSADYAAELEPIQAGWYAGAEVWGSCYGPDMALATDARRFDVSPAWQAFVGADPAIELFASLDAREVWAHASGLGDALCRALGIAEQHQAIVTWPDADGADLERLLAVGLRVSGRAGRVRVAFHVWNTAADVERIVAALGRR